MFLYHASYACVDARTADFLICIPIPIGKHSGQKSRPVDLKVFDFLRDNYINRNISIFRKTLLMLMLFSGILSGGSQSAQDTGKQHQ
jgi:hypothetical protein